MNQNRLRKTPIWENMGEYRKTNNTCRFHIFPGNPLTATAGNSIQGYIVLRLNPYTRSFVSCNLIHRQNENTTAKYSCFTKCKELDSQLWNQQNPSCYLHVNGGASVFIDETVFCIWVHSSYKCENLLFYDLAVLGDSNGPVKLLLPYKKMTCFLHLLQCSEELRCIALCNVFFFFSKISRAEGKNLAFFDQ